MTTRQLDSYERRYRDLARQLSEIGWIAKGSLARRPERCGKANCACASDPARRHGPYWHFTTTVDGKTVNKRLADDVAHLYEEWIANERTVHRLLDDMRSIAAKAQALVVADTAAGRDRQGSRTGSPQTRRAASRHSG